MEHLVMLNNYLHDFSSALWIATMVMVHLMRKNQRQNPVSGMFKMYEQLRPWYWGSFIATLVFGVGRALAYSQYEWNDAAGPSQITLLAVKHTIALGIVIAGIVFWKRSGKVLRAFEEAADGK